MGRGQNPWDTDTAKKRAGSRTGPSETLGSTFKEAPEGHRNRFQRVGTSKKGQRRHPPPGWTTGEGILVLGVVPSFVIWVLNTNFVILFLGRNRAYCHPLSHGRRCRHESPPKPSPLSFPSCKRLTQLRASEDHETLLLSLGSKGPMAMSKASLSYRVDFMVDLVILHG